MQFVTETLTEGPRFTSRGRDGHTHTEAVGGCVCVRARGGSWLLVGGTQGSLRPV